MSKNRKFQGTSGTSSDRRREVLGIVGLGIVVGHDGYPFTLMSSPAR